MTTQQVNTAGMDLQALMQHDRQPAAPAAPPQPMTYVPPAHQQVAGDLPPPGAAPAGVDAAEYREFLAYKASKNAPIPQAPAAPAAPAPAAPVFATPAQAAQEARDSAAVADAARAHDPVMDSMLTIFDNGAKGLDRSRALGNALSHGDPSLVDEAYIRENGGDNAEALIKVARSLVAHATAQVQEVSSAIVASAGGQEQWDAAAAAFNKSASPAMQAYVASEMESGNKARILAAAALVTEQARAAGLVVTPGQQYTPGGAAPGANGSAISKAEFKSELAKLNRRDPNYQAQETALKDRRSRGMAQGL